MPWHQLIGHDIIWHHTTSHGMAFHGMTWHEVVWVHDITWHGMTWCDMIHPFRTTMIRITRVDPGSGNPKSVSYNADCLMPAQTPRVSVQKRQNLVRRNGCAMWYRHAVLSDSLAVQVQAHGLWRDVLLLRPNPTNVSRLLNQFGGAQVELPGYSRVFRRMSLWKPSQSVRAAHH